MTVRDLGWRRMRAEEATDGDSLRAFVELDPADGLVHRERIRLLGLDCPEKTSKDPDERVRALHAAIFTAQWVNDHQNVDGTGLHPTSPYPLNRRFHHVDQHGRIVADVECATCGADLGADLLAAGHAVATDKRGKPLEA